VNSSPNPQLPLFHDSPLCPLSQLDHRRSFSFDDNQWHGYPETFGTPLSSPIDSAFPSSAIIPVFFPVPFLSKGVARYPPAVSHLPLLPKRHFPCPQTQPRSITSHSTNLDDSTQPIFVLSISTTRRLDFGSTTAGWQMDSHLEKIAFGEERAGSSSSRLHRMRTCGSFPPRVM
jgi:hypothetical protein